MLESVLTTLCQELNLGTPPEKTKEGVYPLAISPTLKIDIKPLDPGCGFDATLGELPADVPEREDLLIYLMRANFLCQGTGESAIALDLDEKFLTLSTVLPYDSDYREFKGFLEEFANYVDFWRRELAEWVQKHISDKDN